MAVSNRDRIGKSLELMASGLRPFVEREPKSRLWDSWERAASESQRGTSQAVNWNELTTDPEHDHPTRIYDIASVHERPIASIEK